MHTMPDVTLVNESSRKRCGGAVNDIVARLGEPRSTPTCAPDDASATDLVPRDAPGTLRQLGKMEALP
jgi:hypothetical protein